MNLYKWEMKQMLKSKVFWFIGGAFLLFMWLFHVVEIIKGVPSGYEFFLSLCNDFTSLSMFFICIFAGLHVTGALEERKLQAAIMAGNSRAKVLWTKFASFMSAVAIFFATSVGIPAVIGFAKFGTVCEDGSFIRNVVVRTPLFLIAVIASCSICFVISMFCKKPGIAIIINMIAMLTLNLGSQYLAMKDWGIYVLQLIPHGQEMLVLVDVSNKNIVLSLVVCAVSTAAVLALSHSRFGKEELK